MLWKIANEAGDPHLQGRNILLTAIQCDRLRSERYCQSRFHPPRKGDHLSFVLPNGRRRQPSWSVRRKPIGPLVKEGLISGQGHYYFVTLNTGLVFGVVPQEEQPAKGDYYPRCTTFSIWRAT